MHPHTTASRWRGQKEVPVSKVLTLLIPLPGFARFSALRTDHGPGLPSLALLPHLYSTTFWSFLAQDSGNFHQELSFPAALAPCRAVSRVLQPGSSSM